MPKTKWPEVTEFLHVQPILKARHIHLIGFRYVGKHVVEVDPIVQLPIDVIVYCHAKVHFIETDHVWSRGDEYPASNRH
jgi:hypothetical protein